MAKNYIQEGDVLAFTNNSGAAIVSGQAVLMGKRIGIALGNIAIGATGTVAVEGVFSVPKLVTDVAAQGDLLYWDAANSRLTTTSAGNTQAGYAAAPAGNGAATVNLNVNV